MHKILKIAYIALGANLSNPKANFRGCIADMEAGGLVVKGVSSLWHSPAWPAGLGQPDYVNAGVKIETSLDALDLLMFLHNIEAKYGRRRTTKNAPRPLDLDIIDYAGDILSGRLDLPHPRLLDRPFVLLPLVEIASDWRHPVTGENGLEALSKLTLKDVLAHYVIERDWLKSDTCVSQDEAI